MFSKTRWWIEAALLSGLLSSSLLLQAQFKRADPAQSSYPPINAPAQMPQDQMPPEPSNQGDPGAPIGDGGDPADRQHAVARISFLSGQVNVLRGETAGAVAAAMNAPLVSNDRLQIGERSSAEIEVDANTVLRAAENTDIGFGALADNAFQAQLGAGSVIYRVLRPSSLAGEIDTPNVAVRPAGAVDLRVTVLGDGTTLVQVRSGEAELAGAAGNEHLSAGHAYLIRGNPTDPEYQETAMAQRDGFDEWSAARDNDLMQSQSAQYLPQGVSGAADLDQSGNWVPSEYGQVWTPAGVGPGWAPYSNGFWTYGDYYGWTWVDYSPWGWAPYHYGRWFHNGGYGWCWWPGPRVGFHPWRPALVGFYGWGGGYRGLGWVPLAPYERFHPWWGARGYGGGAFSGTYRNAGYRNAVTFASYNAFSGPGQRFGHLSREQLAGATPLAGRLPVTPVRGSYSFSRQQAFSNARFNNYNARSFVSADRIRPAGTAGGGMATGYSRAQNQSAPNWSHVGANRPSASNNSFSGGSGAGVRNYQSAPRTSSGGLDSGWRRFGDPGSSNAYHQSYSGRAPSQNGESGWHDFGRPAPSPSQNGGRGNYNAPQSQQNFSAPPNRQSFSAPQNRQSYSAPQSHAPAARTSSAPRESGGHGSGNSGGAHGHR